ncbi:MAG: alpha/beta hydrolase, partial [Anaerolineales bacterium]|nr:alpha/beta hydrolase [Anaerolineales bacterium]
VSDIPSLVIEGSFDPATPPFYGKQVAERLANSFYYEFPAMGHVPTTDDACALKIALDFIANPLLRPDDSCLAVSSPADFLVPYTGTPALELNRERISGVTVDVPGDWELTIDGFFWRGASVFDITQVTAFRSDITAQDLVDYFSSSLNGYRGLDGPPAEAGTRRANGYEWIFYYATSNQRPVDIAIAEGGDSSLVIVLFSHPDEHDALYRTVFLPMVDSAR